MQSLWVVPLALLVIFEIIADILAKEYSLKGSWWLFAVALLCFIICNVFWLIALKNGIGLTRGAIYFSASTAILAGIIGMLFYKEQLNAVQLLGATLGIIAIVMLAWE